MNIYPQENPVPFQPTYLYIKQHTITGKLYFGKTVKNPEKYLGSGEYWVRHIKKHGKEYTVNLWYCLFYDKESIEEFALMFSEQENIVESDQWLNLMPENGSTGGHTYTITPEISLKMSKSNKGFSQNARDAAIAANTGKPRTDETKLKLKIANSGVKQSKETIEKRIKFNIGKHSMPRTEEWKRNISISSTGVKQTTATCPHCGKTGGIRAMKRYHFDNCIMNGGVKEKRKPQSLTTCPHCGKTGGSRAMKQWHFDNCKLKI